MKAAKRTRRPREFDRSFPATSANLGPGFDAAALALNLHLQVRAKPAAEYSIEATGRDAEICGRLDRHLIVEVYQETLKRAGRSAPPLAMRLANKIPIGKGCGSSAAARMAGLELANHFGGLKWDEDRIFAEAARLEGHGDNAAACQRGGLALASQDGAGHWQVATIRVGAAWPILLVVPAETLATEEARAALPATYSRGDAVVNVQNSMLLAAAFEQGRGDLLRAATNDRIHQPYRAHLCPLLPALRPLAKSGGPILSATLSGAGPSVLLVVSSASARRKAEQMVRKQLAEAGLEAELIWTNIFQPRRRSQRSRRRLLPI